MTADLGATLTLPPAAFAALPVYVVGPQILCPDCGGDWCRTCQWTGLHLPRPRLADVIVLPTPTAAALAA